MSVAKRKMEGFLHSEFVIIKAFSNIQDNVRHLDDVWMRV